MGKKKKENIDINSLDFKSILEEAVACSRLGRTIASFGATLTGREKHDADLINLMLMAKKPLPERTPATAYFSTEEATKKYTPSELIEWFSQQFPKEAEPLRKRMELEYKKPQTSLVYGIPNNERDLSDEFYLKVLTSTLNIPKQNAAVMYYGSIKPQIERLRKEEGLVKVAVKLKK